uniref:Avl9 domain-containing protein n=1 Tax=Angiostrongylus cantonensis TaxID=6313 RepID=A0A0K0CWA2_ANGCA
MEALDPTLRNPSSGFLLVAVEFSYPKLDGKGEGGLSDEWINLPSLALPDGAHNTNDDVIFFILPSKDRKGESVFGISCCRQIASEDLLLKGDDITRSTVQKSVCVLSRIPLYGALRTKLQVEVLSQMYTNLCDMFDDGAVDEQAASIDISVQDLFLRFRHRTLVLFKLLLLEKKVIPLQCNDIEGLRYCSAPCCDIEKAIEPMTKSTGKRINISGAHYSLIPALTIASWARCHSQKKKINENPTSEFQPLISTEHAKDISEIIIPSSSVTLDKGPVLEKDSFGFPLSIFINGNLFHPYVSLSYLDMIRSKSVRGFTIGATNALFVTKRDLIDVIITVDDQDCGQIEFLDGSLKRELTLTSADLRFGDYLLKNIEENRRSTAMFEGNDEWLRMQMREYLLSMGASSRSDLAVAIADYGVSFIHSWRFTRNYQIWMTGSHEDLSGIAPGYSLSCSSFFERDFRLIASYSKLHAFCGQLGVYDVFLRMEHAVGGSEGARKALSALSSTGKNIGETSSRVRHSVSNWFRGGVTNAEEATEEFTETSPVKGFSTWFRALRDEEADGTAQGQPSSKDSM